MTTEDGNGQWRERQRSFSQQITWEDRRKLGKILRSLRISANMKQGELAARIGVPQSVLQKIEYGYREVTVLELLIVARGLNVSAESILVQLREQLDARE